MNTKELYINYNQLRVQLIFYFGKYGTGSAIFF